MPLILNAAAQLQCAHGGRVTVLARQTQVLVGGAPALRVSDLVGAPILGCPVVPSPGSVPCTLVVEVLPGSWASGVLAAGEPVLLQTLIAVTNGVPPAVVVVLAPGQSQVEASVA